MCYLIVEYVAPDPENTSAYVEEGIADLDEGDVMLEKQALRLYVADLLCRMVSIPTLAPPGHDDELSEPEGSTEDNEIYEEEDFTPDDLAGRSSQLTSPFSSFSGPQHEYVTHSNKGPQGSNEVHYHLQRRIIERNALHRHW